MPRKTNPHPSLLSVAEEFVGERSNPAAKATVTSTADFLEYLASTGADLQSYTPEDYVNAAGILGVPPEEVQKFLEEAASWL